MEFKRIIILISKTLVGLVLLLLTMRTFTVTDEGAIYFGWLFLILFVLPTVFIVFFKNMTLKKRPGFAKYWKVLKMIYVIIVILFILIFVLGIVRLYEKNETKKAIEFINSQKITLDDVMGKNLPLEPNKELNDSTIEGIDANSNGIRDDVELAIFKKYPDSAKIRAAELQLAQKFQTQLTKVNSSETIIEVRGQEAAAYQCLIYAMSGASYSPESKQKDIFENVKYTGSEDTNISNLTLNTKMRFQKYYNDLNEYLISYSFFKERDNNFCDVDISLLPN